MHLFNEDKDTNYLMNKEYIRGLSHLKRDHRMCIELTESDDRIAVNFIDNQNFYALQSIFIREHINSTSIVDAPALKEVRPTIEIMPFVQIVRSHLNSMFDGVFRK